MDSTGISKISTFIYRGSLTILFSLSLLLTGGSGSIYGQSVSITAGFDTTAISIGEQTFFTAVIEQSEGLAIEIPESTDIFPGNIEVLSIEEPDTTLIENNNLRISLSWKITSFYKGYHQVEAVPFLFNDEGELRVLHTRPAGIEVLAPGIDQEAGIYDIKAPFGIPRSFMEIFPWAILSILVLFLIWYAFRYFRAKRSGLPLSSVTRQIEPAHLIAMKELRNLQADSLWQKGMLKEYYTRLTEIIRKYIERRYGVTAMERTSREIIEELDCRTDTVNEVIGLLDECFTLADLVKFAKAQPGEEHHEKCLNTAFHFIKATFKSDEAVPESGLKESAPDSLNLKDGEMVAGKEQYG